MSAYTGNSIQGSQSVEKTPEITATVIDIISSLDSLREKRILLQDVLDRLAPRAVEKIPGSVPETGQSDNSILTGLISIRSALQSENNKFQDILNGFNKLV